MAVRWSGFAGWMAAGALLAVGVAALLTIGVFLLVAGVALVVLLAGRGGAWPDGLGVIAGASAAALVLVAINT